MNFITVIVLSTLLVDFVLHGLADVLNLRMVRDELPEAFQGLYDTDRYRQSQAYLRANTRFGWIVPRHNTDMALFPKGGAAASTQWCAVMQLGAGSAAT